MESKPITSVEGVVTFQRSEGARASDCDCCEGAHIYGRSIEIDREGEPRIFPGLTLESWEQVIEDALITTPDIEGKRVRVSIEFVE